MYCPHHKKVFKDYNTPGILFCSVIGATNSLIPVIGWNNFYRLVIGKYIINSSLIGSKPVLMLHMTFQNNTENLVDDKLWSTKERVFDR